MSNRIEFLKNQFSKIDDETFDKIISYDPTSEKKYSTWLLRLYSKSSLSLNDLPTIKESIELHLNLKNSIPVEFRDINKFDSVISFLHSMNVWFTNRYVENEKNLTYLKNGGELIFENNDAQIIKVLSFEGAKNYGSNTSWCTLQYSNFNSYFEYGELYIIINKTTKYKSFFSKKTQLHFYKNEFRNESNTEVDLIEAVITNPELYEPIKSIKKENKESKEIFNFFNLRESSDSLIKCIESRGYRVLKFIDELSLDFINDLFIHFKEEAYEFIPDSRNKLVSFICNVESGLKTVLKENKLEVDEEAFKQSVREFPENILLMNCSDESLWEFVVMEEAWLVKKSPFINDSEKLLPLIRENLNILKYVVPVKIFSQEQREQIALNLVRDLCDNYLDYLSCLGELTEKTQLVLVKSYPECVEYLISPCDKAVKLSEKLIKQREEEIKKAQQEQKKYSTYNDISDVLSEFYTIKKYNQYGEYNDYNNDYDYQLNKIIKDYILEIEVSGDKKYVRKRFNDGTEQIQEFDQSDYDNPF